MLESKSDSFVISTGLMDSVSRSVLKNVLGQLSDGIWENSSAMRHYWPFVEVEMLNGQVCLVIAKSSNSYGGKNNCGYNYFVNPCKMNMDENKIKVWFAEKIEAIVNEEKKDCPGKDIQFNSVCDRNLDYMYYHNDDGSYRGIRVFEAYAVYKHLKDSVKG